MEAHARSPTRRRTARLLARDLIEARGGYHNRPAGAFHVPPDGTIEPARTERLLARPFRLTAATPADAFQQRLGFLFFRVNGSSRIGVAFRLLVLLVNMMIGALGGLTPLLDDNSPCAAAAQVGSIMLIQMTMAAVCFGCRPDADKVFSAFAGTQFLVEGLSTACNLWGALQQLLLTTPTGSIVMKAHEADEADGAEEGDDAAEAARQALAFVCGLVAMYVPMTQLVEQRVFTPFVGCIRTRGCRPAVLLGLIVIILMSVPKVVARVISTCTGREMGGDGEDSPDLVGAACVVSRKCVATLASGKERRVSASTSAEGRWALVRTRVKQTAGQQENEADDDGGDE